MKLLAEKVDDLTSQLASQAQITSECQDRMRYLEDLIVKLSKGEKIELE